MPELEAAPEPRESDVSASEGRPGRSPRSRRSRFQLVAQALLLAVGSYIGHSPGRVPLGANPLGPGLRGVLWPIREAPGAGWVEVPTDSRPLGVMALYPTPGRSRRNKQRAGMRRGTTSGPYRTLYRAPIARIETEARPHS